MGPRIRSIGKLGIKFALSGAALYIVFQNIDRSQLLVLLKSAQPAWLLLALLAYNASKILSSFRLTHYFQANQILLNERDNLQLYYIGMFYNLFLPGGIGGDAYKIWFLNRDRKASVAKAFQSVFFDRLSGMALLSALGFLFGWLAFPVAPWRDVFLAGAILGIPTLYVVHYLSAKHFLSIFNPTTLLSFGVQSLQVVCAWTLIQSLQIPDHPAAYLTVFLVSSLVSVLPISIGGIGIRELVFITAAGFAPISKDASVAFSLMFFMITAVSSLPGGLLKMKR